MVIACAATLHATGRDIEDAGDAARALEPVAGDLAGALFGAGCWAPGPGGGDPPLTTAYSIGEALGVDAALDDRPREAPVFYIGYVVVVIVAVAVVLVPGMPLVPLLFLSQALNAILLLPLLWLIRAWPPTGTPWASTRWAGRAGADAGRGDGPGRVPPRPRRAVALTPSGPGCGFPAMRSRSPTRRRPRRGA